MVKRYIGLICLMLFLGGCSSEKDVSFGKTIQPALQKLQVVEDIKVVTDVKEVKEYKLLEPKFYTVSMCSVGDNLYHSTVYNKGKTKEGYNFDFVYDNIRDYISGYDLAVVNQETIFVDDNNVSSYPCFGTPKSAGEALINAGFDVFLSATNHTYDKGRSGVESTLDFYSNHPEIDYVGINSSIEEYNSVKIIEKNNIKIALLNYTYGLNGFVIPSEYSYLVDTLYSEEKVKQDLKYAEDNADITIVFPHWGIYAKRLYKRTCK